MMSGFYSTDKDIDRRRPGLIVVALGLGLVLLVGPTGTVAGQAAADGDQAGDTRTYTYRADKTQSTALPGQQPTENRSRLQMTWTIEPLDASSCRITVSEAALHRDPGSSPVWITEANQIQAVVHFDPRGGIASADGLSWNVAIRELGGTGWFISELQRLFLYHPEGELTPGTEWTRERSWPAARSTFDLEYAVTDSFRCTGRTTVNGVEALQIEVTAGVRFTGEGELSGYPAVMAMTGTRTATILVEAATGLVLSYEEHEKSSGGIEVEAAAAVVELDGVATITVGIVR